jgi:hypothetical protein
MHCDKRLPDNSFNPILAGEALVSLIKLSDDETSVSTQKRPSMITSKPANEK